jgi:DNA-binding MarR family transcriptional regulator
MKENMIVETELVNLSFLQIRTLTFIHRSGTAVQMKDIAEHFSIEMPTATSLLNKLARLHLVTRTIDKKDRRVVRVSLSKKGEQVLEEALRMKTQRIEQILAHLSDEQQKNLYTILQTLAEKLV